MSGNKALSAHRLSMWFAVEIITGALINSNMKAARERDERPCICTPQLLEAVESRLCIIYKRIAGRRQPVPMSAKSPEVR